MKGIIEVVTDKEMQTASMLSKSRSDIFLESRGYIRKSLANLFHLNPLDIPIEANPSKPPKLPEGMGQISISHCNDALIIIWHTEKVGIDIERSDRDFKYKDIAKKYCFNCDQLEKVNITNKNEVLRQWSAIEAAIKLDRGTLSKDLKEWKYLKNKNTLFHKKKKLKLYINHLNFYRWTISIAYEAKENLGIQEIICTNTIFP